MSAVLDHYDRFPLLVDAFRDWPYRRARLAAIEELRLQEELVVRPREAAVVTHRGRSTAQAEGCVARFCLWLRHPPPATRQDEEVHRGGTSARGAAPLEEEERSKRFVSFGGGRPTDRALPAAVERGPRTRVRR